MVQKVSGTQGCCLLRHDWWHDWWHDWGASPVFSKGLSVSVFIICRLAKDSSEFRWWWRMAWLSAHLRTL